MWRSDTENYSLHAKRASSNQSTIRPIRQGQMQNSGLITRANRLFEVLRINQKSKISCPSGRLAIEARSRFTRVKSHHFETRIRLCNVHSTVILNFATRRYAILEWQALFTLLAILMDGARTNLHLLRGTVSMKISGIWRQTYSYTCRRAAETLCDSESPI